MWQNEQNNGYHMVSQHVPLTSISFLVPCFYDPHKQQASQHPRKTVRPLALQNMPGLTTGPRAFAAVKVMGLEHLGLKEIAIKCGVVTVHF